MTTSQDIFLIRHNEEFVLYAPLKGKAYLINKSAAAGLLSSTEDESIIANINNLLKEERVAFEPHELGAQDRCLESEYEPTSVTLFPTSDCNLRCVYCFASAGERKDSLRLDHAMQAIDLVLANAKKLGKKARVRFHGGGEPFVNFKLIKLAVEYAKIEASKLSVGISFGAVTNGLLNQEVMQWIVENIDSISLSFDGPSNLQNANRPTKSGMGSFCFVEETIRYFENSNQNYSIRATATINNINQLEELIDYVRENTSLKSIHIEPVFKWGRGSHDGDFYLTTEEFYSNFLLARKYARLHGIEIHYSGALLKNRGSIFCGATWDNFLVTPQGKITTCIEVPNESDYGSDIFHIGSINTNGVEIETHKLSYLRKRTLGNLPGCSDCFAKYNCAGDCSFKNYVITGDIFDTGRDQRCDMNRKILLDELVSKLS